MGVAMGVTDPQVVDVDEVPTTTTHHISCQKYYRMTTSVGRAGA